MPRDLYHEDDDDPIGDYEDPEYEAPEPPPQISAHRAAEARRILQELALRECEALKLYKPLPVQAEFHKSKAPERLVRGSNRSGKTLSTCVEVARALTGQDPHDKYPKQNGRCIIVGKDGMEVGQVLYRKLFRAGAFKIIRSTTTGKWRAFRRWDANDMARESEARLAPPLIPPRYIKEIGWRDKKGEWPRVVRLHTGWEAMFLSSEGLPPHGMDVDLALFDEEIQHPSWYTEIAARLVDRRGKFIWGATPQTGTDRLYDLHERAVREHGKENPAVEEFVTLLDENPHVGAAEKQQLAEKLDDEERRVRIGGEFALTSFKVYPEYSPGRYNVEWQPIPAKWTRYVAIDPGFQICAALFLAVPTPDVGDYVYLYDELYIGRCDAAKFGEAMRHKTEGQEFEAFIIDGHAGRVTQMGAGMTVEKQYRDALFENKISSRRTGHGFVWGADDPSGGILACKAWLRDRGEMGPKLRVLKDACPNFEWEMRRYHYQRDPNGGVTDKPHSRGATHLCDCFRYLSMYEPEYMAPGKGKEPLGEVYKAFLAKLKKQQQHDGGGYVRLGPGSTVGVA